MRKTLKHERGSENVFADLGLSDPEERLAKAKLAIQISKAIDERGLTQNEAAKVLEIDQPKMSDLLHGKLKDFSTEQLFCFLTLVRRV